MNLKKIIYIIVGCLCLALGCIGIVLPILPTVPFFLVTVFCFARSSEKLHSWFIGTKMYKNNLDCYVRGQGMTKDTKLKILLSVTALMAVGFVIMMRKSLYIPCGILAFVWIAHIIYFVFGVKTLSGQTE